MYADGLSFMISQFVYSGDDSLQSISLLGAMAPLDVVSVNLDCHLTCHGSAVRL